MRTTCNPAVPASRRAPVFCLAFVCVLLFPAVAAAGPGLDRLDRFFAGFNGLDTGFEQTVTDNAQRPTQQTRGRLQILRPGRFRWTYEEPYQQLIVTDGARLWVYDPDLAQVTITSLDTSIGNTPALLLSTERPLDELFMITELPAQDGIAWVQLDPRQQDANFTRVRLAFDRETLYAMEIVDGFGQTMNIRFLGLRRNPALEPADFRFTPPAGVDVVGDG